MVGSDPLLIEVFDVIERVADTGCTVLITGETGTGKELVAQAIHRASGRADGPFVTVNCAAIPRELVESELFGHARGAFTGATQSRVGRFQAADGGTLFLDEIGEMEPPLQRKLLRVLQDCEFTPVGETRSVRVDVRVVAATNRDLDRMCADGSFREDLYYRLNVIPIDMAPLRERRGDIVPLARHFVAAFARRHGRRVTGFTESAELALVAYDWPGNVRQLENTVERLVILKREGEIRLEDLPERMRGRRAEDSMFGAVRLPQAGLDLNEALEECEVRLILQALERTAGNKAQAATLLHLNRTTLVEKLRKRNLLNTAA